MANHCLFESNIKTFINEKLEIIRDTLSTGYHGTELTTTKEAWSAEIEILQNILSPWANTQEHIIFEYDIPRLGKRIDVVLLLKGIIFCLEFKVGQSSILEIDIDQVLDYALDLRNFHKLSQDKIIVPILIATNTNKYSTDIKYSIYDNKVLNPLVTGTNNLARLLNSVISKFPNEKPLNNKEWIKSPYTPTPTIIEAARTLYENHNVEEITRH